MNVIMKYLIIACIIVSLILISLLIPSQNIVTENADLSLTISMDKTSFNAEESIILYVTLENIGNDTVRTNELTMKYDSLFLNVTDTIGNEMELIGVRIRNPGDSIVLRPSQEITMEYDLIEYVYFNDDAISYNLNMEYKSYGYSSDDKETWRGSVDSNTLTFTISS
ncbi:MAG: hypothetical protein KAS32_07285 [Candidatus Peribacteraceae bacterium]|nr:hypothetical protein [Candidatus Peribacteraceae bacterium]